jgi:hypothetical protein
MVSIPLIISIVIAAIAVGLGGAYMAGMLDQVIEKIGIYLFKAEAKAEKKKLESQGLKEGEDFSEGKWAFYSLQRQIAVTYSSVTTILFCITLYNANR